ncbi:hypothetical protein J6590_062592 [Homalodisca vitripennis]|nr:hypothetical protein J6590_062592 [Homalodisca vitripennis]
MWSEIDMESETECYLEIVVVSEQKVLQRKNCQKNYEGTSGGMETVAVVTVCLRSEAKRNVRYVKE